MVRGEQFDAREFCLERVEEPGFARLRAGRADRVAQKDDVALSAEQFAQVVAGQLPALVVVRGDEADVWVRLESGVEDDHGDSCLDGILDRFHQGLRIQRRQHDSTDPAAHEVLDHLDLLIPVILL